MLEITVTDAWRAAHAGGCIGVMELRGASNAPACAALDARATALETGLRARHAGATRAELRQIPALRAYADYYKRYDKTYHVQLQLESVALKGKALPRGGALVEALFIAELDNLLLTAAHDLTTLAPPLRLDSATGAETYTLANGQPATLKPGDMCMADADGVICSILYGQDARTRLTPATLDALYVVYAPRGITPESVEQHLRDIADLAQACAPDARVAGLEVLVAG